MNGSGAIILGSVTIGLNSIIGAGSVVTKDADANSFFAGVLARHVAAASELLDNLFALRKTFLLRNFSTSFFVIRALLFVDQRCSFILLSKTPVFGTR